ncbi:MAG: glycosyltransferase family 4 protein [Candidatus Aenigmarchaeota archaeon]|nr:glycosyltransferase family 4 protein [Candidatus Aenigmarchaeota archaeon]
MKKPKVCYLWFEFISGSAGGAISHMEGFLSGLKTVGCDTIIISPKRFDFLKKHKNVHYLEWTSKSKFIVNANFLKYAKIKKIIEKEKPDIIYQRHVAFTDVGARIAKEFKIPFILEYNGPLTWVTKHWAQNPTRRLFAEILSPVSTYYEHRVIQGATILTVISKPLERLLEKIHVSKSKILFNPNGVDADKFNQKISGTKIREKYKIPKKAIVVGFIGTFGRWHGAEVLARTAKELVFKKKNIFFLFMGDGHYKKQSETIAGTSKQIIFTGSVPREQVPEHLAACDILVNPTVPNPDGTEFFGSPTKLFEYMAMGNAIISSNIGQMKEILENEKEALLVDAADSGKLKDALLVLSKDKKLRESLGKNARKKVVKEYTWNKNAKRVLKEYEKLQRLRE